MLRLFACALIASVAAAALAHAEMPPPDKTPKPAATKPAPAKPAPGDPAALSGAFWGDWNKTKGSEDFAALKTKVGCADKTKATAAAAKPGKQQIVDLAVARPEEAAKLLAGASAAAATDAANANALATVVNMVTTQKTRDAAVAEVAPEDKARVETMNANLSTGIDGLPGIYLGDVEQSAPRASAPTGYTPVSGGSFGCPAR
ncbi:MAG: hypothetical protein HOP13_12020 [Alphaproteobacteria bacterium]|nr:hypothetical protein [Alphaproteobacteria bacterium]